MQPTHTDVHTDKVLTNVLVAYRDPDVIWSEIAPVIDTGGRESDKYYKYDKGPWLTKDADLMAPGDPAPISGFTISSDTFSCNEYGISTFIADRTLENADAVLKQGLRQDAAIWCMDDLNRKMESDLAAAVFTTSVWGNDKTGGTDFTQWSDKNNSTPLDDVIDGKSTIRGDTGKRPNRMAIGDQVWDELQRNSQLIDALGANERGFVTPGTVAEFMGLDKLLIGTAVYNSANEGQTASMTRVWGKHALLYYCPERPGRMTPSAAYTFQAQPVEVRRWREDNSVHRKVEFVEASIIQGYKVVGTDLGYFFSGAVA